jgi:hypothetical protein
LMAAHPLRTNLMQRGFSNEQRPGVQHGLHARQALRRRAPAAAEGAQRSKGTHGQQAAGGRRKADQEHGKAGACVQRDIWSAPIACLPSGNASPSPAHSASSAHQSAMKAVPAVVG